MTTHIDSENFVTFTELNNQLGIVKVTAAGLDKLGVTPAYIVGTTRYYPKQAVLAARQAIGSYLLEGTSLLKINEPGQESPSSCNESGFP